MITCGLKLTHDGAIALLHGDKLVFSIEMEKIGNGDRYSQVDDLDVVPGLLAAHGYTLDDVDAWVVDGWDGAEYGTAELASAGSPVALTVAPYRETAACPDLLAPAVAARIPIAGRELPYVSYLHVAGHVASAYCTSPFAVRRESSYVLVWDGGLFPRLYYAEPDGGIVNHGELFALTGHAYATAGHHFGPFYRADEALTVDDLSVAGKLMAYVALGRPRTDVLDVLAAAFHDHFEADTEAVAHYRATVGGFGSNSEPSVRHLHAWFRDVRERLAAGPDPAPDDEDVLASVHEFLERLLVDRVSTKVRELAGSEPVNLCFVGGCALNVKWNSALRDAPALAEVWVPPFPNDSGSAIGTAAAHVAAEQGLRALNWHVRSGPVLAPPVDLPAGWTAAPCTPAELAGILHEEGRPVVVLNGRAELGPRALGGRSILAPAIDPTMKDELNRIKKREPYRPVAPICLTEFAPEIFDPGTPDPYMLFDHEVRPEYVDRIPAVLHLDGTARLQTVAVTDDPVLELVLREYHRRSGVPVLCNTSANLNGSGFFPDVASALRWGQIDTVWGEGTLYRRVGD